MVLIFIFSLDLIYQNFFLFNIFGMRFLFQGDKFFEEVVAGAF